MFFATLFAQIGINHVNTFSVGVYFNYVTKQDVFGGHSDGARGRPACASDAGAAHFGPRNATSVETRAIPNISMPSIPAMRNAQTRARARV